jgi:cell division protein FtsL
MAVLNRTLSRTQHKAEGVRLAPVLIAAGVALLGIAVLQVVQTSEATTSSFAIQRLEQERLELEASVRQIEAEVASLSSLSRIEREAARLGLGPAQAYRTVYVDAVWQGADEVGLPSRFAPEDENAEQEGKGSAWWQDLLKALPFN